MQTLLLKAMSEACTITTCKKTSRALCYCCQQSLCMVHLKEHSDILLNQLNPLVDQINDIGDRLKAINLENEIDICRQKLEQWRTDCYKKIDDMFEQKLKEINRHISQKMEKQREELNRVQKKIGSYLEEEEVSRQDIDVLTSTIEKLDQEIKANENPRCIVKIQPLVIDTNLIRIEQLILNEFDLYRLGPIQKTIDCQNISYTPLASNDDLLLMHLNLNLCLIDRNFEIIRQTRWDHEIISNICWSSTLDRFIIVSEQGVLCINEKTMIIEKLQVAQEKEYCACACSENSLFLCTYELGSTIEEYTLLPSMKLMRTWTFPQTCQETEWITDMKFTNVSIALLIKDTSEERLFLELKDINTFNRLWSCQIDCVNLSKEIYRCSLVNYEEWLVLERASSRFILITKEGKIKSSCSYNSTPLYATMFGSDIIAVATENGVNFHNVDH